MAELQIQINANVAGAVQGLNQIQSELDQTSKGAITVSGAVNQAATSLNRLPQTANQATTAVGNLSRIVQDAPFGFIAISNNLQPLFDDFTRLKGTTGSVGGAFKSLIGAIAGPAGIGLAFAAATSLITVFSKELFGSGQAAKKAKTDVDDFNKSLDNAKASALSSGLQLQKFVDIAKDGNLPLSQRNEALKQANNILGDYGEKLTLVNVTTQKATELVNEYTQGLIAQALANQLADKAATLLVNQANAQKQVTEAQLAYNKAQAAFVNRPQFTLREQELGRSQVYIIERDKALKNLNDRQKEYTKITQDLTDVTALFNEQSSKSTLILGKVGTKVKDNIKNIGKLDFAEFLQQQEIEVPLVFSDDPIEIGKSVSPVGAIIKNELENYFKRTEKLDAGLLFAVDEQKLKKFEFMGFKNLTKEQKELADTGALIANTITPSLEAMIQAIGRGENAFQAFGNGVKAVLIQVIQKLTATAILAGILSALFPGTGLGGSVGFQAIFGKLLGFRANGGPVTGNSPYIVGERGPELFVPSVSGSIVPNNAVGSFMGGRMSGSGGGSIVRGQDILLAYARTQRSQLRVNG